MTLDSDHGVVAVPEGAKGAGAIVYWNLSGSTDAATLHQAWRDFGLPMEWLLELPTPEVALRRAVGEQREAHRLVRSLKNGGWAIVREKQSENDLDYGTELKVSLSATGQLRFVGAAVMDQARIAAAYDKHLENLSREDIGAWLATLVPRLDAVALRASGGVYFIPPTSMAKWEAVRDAVGEASSTRLYEVPALQAKSAVEAILDAVTAEAAEAFTAVEHELLQNAKLADKHDFHQDPTEPREVGKCDYTFADGDHCGRPMDTHGDVPPPLGSRALENRSAQLAAVRAKVMRYEALLGEKLTTLQEHLSNAQSAAAAAAMTAHARESTESEQ